MGKTSFKWKNADGCVTAGTIFLLFLVVATAYLAIKFVPPYFHYYMLKGEVEAEADGAHLHYDQDIISNIKRFFLTYIPSSLLKLNSNTGSSVNDRRFN